MGLAELARFIAAEPDFDTRWRLVVEFLKLFQQEPAASPEHLRCRGRLGGIIQCASSTTLPAPRSRVVLPVPWSPRSTSTAAAGIGICPACMPLASHAAGRPARPTAKAAADNRRDTKPRSTEARDPPYHPICLYRSRPLLVHRGGTSRDCGHRLRRVDDQGCHIRR